MMGETEKQKAIRAFFPSIAGVLEQGGDWQSSPAGRLRSWGGGWEGPPRVVGLRAVDMCKLLWWQHPWAGG